MIVQWLLRPCHATIATRHASRVCKSGSMAIAPSAAHRTKSICEPSAWDSSLAVDNSDEIPCGYDDTTTGHCDVPQAIRGSTGADRESVGSSGKVYAWIVASQVVVVVQYMAGEETVWLSVPVWEPPTRHWCRMDRTRNRQGHG